MRRIQNLLITLFAFCILISSCSRSHDRNTEVHQWMTPNGKVKVLSTISMIDDIVRRIGKEHVDGHVLIKGELNPHSYQLVKGDDEKISFANVIFFNGLMLEHGPSLQKALEEKENAVGLGDRIQKDSPEVILDYNGQVDPHIWMDVSMWMRTIPYIVETLSNYDPEHAQEYKKNGEELTKELEQVHKEIRRQLQSIPEEKRFLVTSHDAFNYFSRAYLATEEELAQNTWQKRFAAPEGLAPDSQLSTSDIQQIVTHLEKYHVQVLFPESNVSRDSIRKIVDAGKEKGLDVFIANCPLYADAMGPPGSEGDTYVKMVSWNAKLIGLYLKDYNPRTVPECP